MEDISVNNIFLETFEEEKIKMLRENTDLCNL